MDKFLIRKDVYDDLIEKGYGKRDLSKLTKKQITDKNGHKRTVYVKNGEQPAETKQPTAQKELSPEKRARYEEMLEKVKAGSDENALFVSSKGMLNKKDAIAYLEGKLGRAKNKNETVLNSKKTEEYKENYLDARNEAGKDIAENNKIQTLSDKIEFSPDEMKMIRETAKEIGYRVGRDEGKLLNVINSKDKAMYSALTKKNKKVWDESGKTQKTFSSTDLLREKIQSMNGDFGADDSNTDSKFDEEEDDTNKISFKDKVEEWKSKGLDNRAAHAKVAIDEIVEQIKATPKTDEKKLEELSDLMTDVQLNGLNSKYIKNKLEEEKKTKNPEKVKAKEEYMNEVSDWQKKGLPRDAAFAKVALDKIVEEIKKTPEDDVQKLDELDNAFRDVQKNNVRSKYIQNILNIE